MNLSNNTILITGGGSGIGLALAVELLNYNNKIIIAGRNIEKLQLAQTNHPKLEILQVDISDEASVKKLTYEVLEKYPDLNFLINNAGVINLWKIKTKKVSISGQKAELLTNVFGTIQLTQSLIPFLLNKKNATILNVSSALAFVPMASAPIYSATKAALHSYTISLRQQLHGTNVKIFEVLPAAVNTDMSSHIEKKAGIKDGGQGMPPEKLSILILKGLKKDNFEIRPGMSNMLYYLNRVFPALVEGMLEKQSKKMLIK